MGNFVEIQHSWPCRLTPTGSAPLQTTVLSLINSVDTAVDNLRLGVCSGFHSLLYTRLFHKWVRKWLLIHLRTAISPQVIHRCGERRPGAPVRARRRPGEAKPALELQLCKLPTLWISAVENRNAPGTGSDGGIMWPAGRGGFRAPPVPSWRRREAPQQRPGRVPGGRPGGVRAACRQGRQRKAHRLLARPGGPARRCGGSGNQ